MPQPKDTAPEKKPTTGPGNLVRDQPFATEDQKKKWVTFPQGLAEEGLRPKS